MSGVYIAHLRRNDTGGSSLIPFVVRDDASHSDVVLQTSDETWQAYNPTAGRPYVCSDPCPAGNPAGYQGAFKVSYNRPWNTPEADGGLSWLFNGAEYSMIRFLEENGYDLSYMSSNDIDVRARSSLNHKFFVSSGHDEYWSARPAQ